MANNFFKNKIPSQEQLKNSKSLAFLNNFIHDPNLWHINKHSISGAFAVGLFFTWVPVPFQMVFAAIVAIIFRVNLPVSAALVWLTNPVTMPAMFYAAYRLGLWVLDEPYKIENFHFSYEWLEHMIGYIWQPFLLGCLIFGVLFSLTGYLGVRLVWRLKIVTKWSSRKNKKA